VTVAHRLLDVGGGARLERFGTHVIDRPLPTALGARLDPDAWRAADLRFEREHGWSGDAAERLPWPIEVDGITLELRTTEAGQVGFFPEHAAMLPWLRRQVMASTELGETPAILHLFAYTGLSTLAMAAAGARVTHVDASRPTVGWARHNAGLSGLAERPIRWIVDDAAAFTGREVRRGRRYAGVVLDPPSYGHGPGAGAWRISDDLAPLLASIALLLVPDGFLLLTAHTPELSPDRLADAAARALGRPTNTLEAGDLELVTPDGRRAELGAFARTSGGAS
jgi:23S rRNA (cytosine1962-C5)-methyltransferase